GETLGSIMVPAAFTGVTGFRPSYGLVSRFGAMDLSWSMEKIGPLARSADDCALVARELIGYDERDPMSVGIKIRASLISGGQLRLADLQSDLSDLPLTD